MPETVYSPYSPLLKAIKKEGRTENDCLTNVTSDNPSVNLFFSLNAMRGADTENLWNLFMQAFEQNELNAIRILFYSRDIRGGQGERQIFRNLLFKIACFTATSPWLERNLNLIPTYGRWDDLLTLFNTPFEELALEVIKKGLLSEDALCGKWMPREKSSKRSYALKIMSHMGLTPKQYRTLLSRLTNVVETKMCSQEWDEIEFHQVPSVAMRNYRNTFSKHCTAWEQYLLDLEEGKTKVNASTLYPHDIVAPFFNSDSCYCFAPQGVSESRLLEQQWKALPNYMGENENKILPVIDVSGSMYSSLSNVMPIVASVALGMYIAERNKGPFKDHFITFSGEPSLEKITGDNLSDRIKNIQSSNWGLNTNLSKVFDLLLESGKKNGVDSQDMPDKILILSDMEFDRACSDGVDTTMWNRILTGYYNSIYTPPGIIFWNLNAKGHNFPVKFDQMGSALVSGYSPSIMKQILSTKTLTPENIMHNVLDDERYSQIK